MSHIEYQNENLKQIAEKIKDIRIAMMTTAEQDGTLHSRPMATQEMQVDGTLWFFTYASTPKVDEVQQQQQINLSYVEPKDERYVSLAGTAQLVRDQNKVHELWKPFLKAWFPEGADNPELALLKVTIQGGEYWDGPSSKMVQIAKLATALATGKSAQDVGMGENKKIDAR